MKTRNRTSNRERGDRSGTVTLEAAIILPVMILIVIGAIDIGQFVNLSQIVNNASREGARVASRDITTSVEEVEASVREYLSDTFSGIPAEELNAAITITVSQLDGAPIAYGNLEEVESGTTLKVKVDFNFDTIRWFKRRCLLGYSTRRHRDILSERVVLNNRPFQSHVEREVQQ